MLFLAALLCSEGLVCSAAPQDKPALNSSAMLMEFFVTKYLHFSYALFCALMYYVSYEQYLFGKDRFHAWCFQELIKN